MQGPFPTPAALAQALLRGAITPERIRKLLRHAKKGTRAEFEATLVALPEAVRGPVKDAAITGFFRG